MYPSTNNEKAPGTFDSKRFGVNATCDSEFPTGRRVSMAFVSLAARFTAAGHTSTRSNPADGAAIYYAGRWGMNRPLADLDVAALFLKQVGGQL